MTKSPKAPIQALQIAQNAVEQTMQKQNLEIYAQEFFGFGPGSKLEKILLDVHSKALAKFDELELTDAQKQELAFKHKQLIVDLVKSKGPNISLNQNVNNFNNFEGKDQLDSNLMNIINLTPINELPAIPDEENAGGIQPVSPARHKSVTKRKGKSKSASRKK